MKEKIPYLVTTEDGYSFTPLDNNGSWGDNDGSWASFEEMIKDLEELELNLKIYYRGV